MLKSRLFRVLWLVGVVIGFTRLEWPWMFLSHHDLYVSQVMEHDALVDFWWWVIFIPFMSSVGLYWVVSWIRRGE